MRTIVTDLFPRKVYNCSLCLLFSPTPPRRIAQVIKTREEGNPAFSFLFDLDGAEGQYYRWRTYGEKCTPPSW